MKTLQQIIYPHLRRVLTYGNKLQCHLYVWDSTEKQIKYKSGKSLLCVRMILITSLFWVFGQMVFLFQGRSASTIDQMLGGVIFFSYLSMLLVRWEWTPNPDCVQLMNLFLHGIELKGKLSQFV